MPDLDEQSPAFSLLSDLIADGNIVAVTGAGISRGLKREKGSGGIPGWKELLQRIHTVVRKSISTNENMVIDNIFSLKDIPTQCLVEIATKLRHADESAYETELFRQVTPSKGQYEKSHTAITNLDPRGIVTFNYDDCHENAYKAILGNIPDVLTPYTENKLVLHLSNKLNKPFILKAHGNIHDTGGNLVLDWNTYRTLLAKEPTYRAFFQHILTNFNCLFVGFGLSDPDFDMFLDTIASTYGSPISTHVAIRHINDISAEEFVWKERYGIHCLHVSDHKIIPYLITKSSQTAGPKLKKWIDKALSKDMKDRQKAHKYFRKLSTLGKRCASESFKTLMKLEKNEFRISEIVFSLGVIDPVGNKEEIMSVLMNNTHTTSMPAGRALTQLRSVLTIDDIEKVREWKDYYSKNKYPDDKKDRLEQYCDYYLVYLPSKFAS